MFLCTPFASHYFIYSDWAFEVILHSSSVRRDSTVAQKCHGNFNLLTAISIYSRKFQPVHGN